ncbi:MAG: glycosyltransferase, partial [Thermoprotei archaeon]
MKIVFYGLSLGPPWVEGLRNTVRSLSKRLVEKGFEVSVLTKSPRQEVFEGVRYVGLNIGGEAYSENAPTTLAAIARWIWLNSASFDIVHGHSSFPLIALPGILAKTTCVFTLYSPLDAAGRFIG